MVTSSAVVGSSAIKQLRIAGERDRDHHPLPHAAGQPVRIVVEALLRRRDFDASQQLDSRVRALLAGDRPRWRMRVSPICSPIEYSD